MLHIFAYIYEKQYDRKILKNLDDEYTFTEEKNQVHVYVCMYIYMCLTCFIS